MRDVDDSVLGKLRWDESRQSLDGELRTPAGPVELSLEVVDESSLADQLTRARSLVSHLPGAMERARRFAADRLVGLKNDGYLEQGEAPLSQEEFATRLGLPRVELMLDGPCHFVFGDDEMLWGHFISVASDDDGTPRNAEMWG